MHVIVPHRLRDSETLRSTDRVKCSPYAPFPIPPELVGLTVSEARARWCGDVLDPDPLEFYRLDEPPYLANCSALS